MAYLNSHDQDVSSVGPLILPDQSPGPPTCSQSPCHEVIASGKNKEVYVLDRDNMGGYWSNPGCLPPAVCDPQILQELALTGGSGELMASPAYWNSTVYFAPDGAPIQAFQVTGGSTPLVPLVQTSKKYVGAHAPSVSSNGNTNGILWILSGNNLDAFDAVSLNLLYSSSQAGTRDKFPKLAHFATQTIANGKVYVATQSTLEVFGLFHIMSVTGGNNQTAQVLNTLPQPIQISTTDPYNGQPISGVTITFSDGNKGGMFSQTMVTTDANGNASTTYTFPKKSGVIYADGFSNQFRQRNRHRDCNPRRCHELDYLLWSETNRRRRNGIAQRSVRAGKRRLQQPGAGHHSELLLQSGRRH